MAVGRKNPIISSIFDAVILAILRNWSSTLML